MNLKKLGKFLKKNGKNFVSNLYPWHRLNYFFKTAFDMLKNLELNFYLPSVSDFSLVATFNDMFDARLTGKISDEMQKVNYTAKFEVLTHSIFATVGYDVTTEHKKIDFTINPYVQIIGEIKDNR